MSYESFGVVYRVELGEGLRAHVYASALPPGARRVRLAPSRTYRIARQRSGYTLTIEGSALACATVRALRDALEGDLALYVAANARSHVFIHAGTVVWRGRALIFPGRTMTGKSTLVAALVKSGATYYSDEYAVVDARGRVLPYPRALSLRRNNALPRRTLPKRRGCKVATPGWVLETSFAPGAALQLSALAPGETALLLLANAVAARLSPVRVLAAVRKVAAVAKGVRVRRGEASGAARQLLVHCGG